MFGERHGGAGLGIDGRPGPVQAVAAFDRAVDPPLARHLEKAALHERADLPVDGGLGDVGHPGAQLRGRPGLVAREGVHDPEPDGVHEQLKRVHCRMFSHLLPFAGMRIRAHREEQPMPDIPVEPRQSPKVPPAPVGHYHARSHRRVGQH